MYLKSSMSYMRHLPPASPSQVDFQRRQVESMTLPKRIGEGMYPNRRKITNWIPRAKAFSSSSTDLLRKFARFVRCRRGQMLDNLSPPVWQCFSGNFQMKRGQNQECCENPAWEKNLPSHLNTTMSTGICVTATTNVMKKSSTMNGIIIWHCV